MVYCLISYVNGRYSFYRENENKLSKLYKLLINSILVILCAYIFDKLLIIYFNDWIPIGRNNGLIIFIFSYLIQSIKFYLRTFLVQKKFIYLIGEEKQKEDFKKYIYKFSINKNVIINDFKNYQNKFKEYNTFIILDSNSKYYLEDLELQHNELCV